MQSRILLLIVALFSLSIGLTAQTLSPKVTPAQGGYFSAGGNSLSWTLGETVTPTLNAGSNELTQGFQQPEVEILTSTITGGPFCAGGSISIPFTATGIVDASNVFTAQLSNSSGSFGSPVTLSTLTGNTSGTISGTIPGGTSAGSGYKIRVVASSPVYTGVENGANITINVCSGFTWVGGSSTDWSTSSNWSGGVVPNNCANNVTIPSGTTFSPIISASAISVGDISIASGVTLTLSGHNLNVCGNWTGGSSTNAAVVGSGTVFINGASAQTIDGNTQFQILQINNGNGVSLLSAAIASIAKGLHLQHGLLNVSAGTLRLLSAASNNNSYIDDFTAGFDGTVSGNIIADRYVPVPGYNEHLISSPVNAPSLTQLGASGPDGVYVTPTANCDEASSASNSAYGSVFVYNDGHAPSGACMLGNWMIKSAGNVDNARGYSAYLHGNSNLSLTGGANTGDISVGNLNNSGYPTVNTLQGQAIESGWNLVGNPYPSALDLTTDRTPDAFQNQVQIWQTIGPFAGSWQPGVISGIPGQVVVPPFQAFMVRVSPGSLGLHTYKFYQAERTRTTNLTFYRTKSDNILSLVLDFNGVKDITTVAFNPSATNAFDDAYDANKYDGSLGRPTIYTHLSANEWYAINTLPTLAQTVTVPMGLRPEGNGTMTLTPQGLQSFDPTTYIVLEDKQTGIWHNLRDGAYTFTTTTTDNQERFVLHFTPPAQILTSDANCDMDGQINIEQPGSVNWNYTVTDATNAIISAGVLNQYSPVSVSVPAGTYALSLSDNSGYTVIKNVTVGGLQAVSASFTSTANTVEVQDAVQFISTSNSNLCNWNFGDGTTADGINPTHVYQNEGVYTVTLTVTNPQGCTSIATHKITVTSRSATAVNNITGTDPISIWSSDNRIFVDFTKQTKVEADIEIYNVLGQLINREKFGHSTIYSRQIDNLEAAYMIVRVKNGEELITKKVFISNIK